MERRRRLVTCGTLPVVAAGLVLGACGGSEPKLWTAARRQEVTDRILAGTSVSQEQARCISEKMAARWSYDQLQTQGGDEFNATKLGFESDCKVSESSTTSSTTTTTTQPALAATTTTSAQPPAASTESAARADCTTRSPSPRAFSVANASGPYPAHFTQIGAKSQQFDIIQGRHDPNNGWTWINENPLLHWAPLSPNASVWIYPGGNEPTAQLERMPITAIEEYPTSEGRVFWLTFADGMITDVCEQWSV